MEPKVIATATVSEYFIGAKATKAMVIIAIFSLLLAFLVTAGVIYVGKVRERMAMGG